MPERTASDMETLANRLSYWSAYVEGVPASDQSVAPGVIRLSVSRFRLLHFQGIEEREKDQRIASPRENVLGQAQPRQLPEAGQLPLLPVLAARHRGRPVRPWLPEMVVRLLAEENFRRRLV